MRSGILAGGNWIIDQVKLIDTWPPQDSLASISSESASNGGGPYNVLKDLARMGAPFPLSAAGLVGDDDRGRAIAQDCKKSGIDTAQLKATRQAPTSYTDVMTVRGTGRRTFFHQRGANALLGPKDFDFTNTRARIFHLGYLLLLDRLDCPGPDGRPAAAEVLARASKEGIATSLDCVSEASERFKAIATPVLPEVDYFFANDFEAERITGITLSHGGVVEPGAVERAAQALVALGVRRQVFIHFPEGAYARSASGAGAWQPSVRVPPGEIAGAAGAGDAFAAGVLYGLHEGWEPQRGLKLGACAAAASLSHPTCSEGVGTLAQCLALGERLGFRPLPMTD